MQKIQVSTSQLNGSLQIPPSKSQTLRAILFAALAQGKSLISNYLISPDTEAMLDAIAKFGAKVQKNNDTIEINGFANCQKPTEDVIFAGNSGIVLRFISALSALSDQYTIITGDRSIRHNRPMKPLLDALSDLGAFAISSRGDGFAPVIIRGPITKNKVFICGQDSQPISALLIALSFAPHPVEIFVENPGEKPWVDLTLEWLKRFQIPVKNENYLYYQTQGKAKISGFEYVVPADFSSAAFPICAALMTNSYLKVENLNLEDPQGDKILLSILQKMGANFTINQSNIEIHPGKKLKGVKIDLNSCIDALPVLAAIATTASSPTEIYNAAIARTKESDRISAITQELRKMNAQIEEKPDGLIIYPSELKGAFLEAHDDHRIAMSLTIAALRANSMSTISGVDCIAKTYKNFFQDLKSVGANIKSFESLVS